MKNNNTPMRRCIGCMASYQKEDLIRIAFNSGEFTVDRLGNADGRGVYLCKNCDCVERARKSKALNRSFKRNFDIKSTDKVLDEVLEIVKEVVNV